MGLLGELGKGQGYLRAGFLGFQSSGKTYTATRLAIGLYKYFKLDGRIAMFDTEGGSEYIAKIIKKETGQSLLGVKSQSFQDLLDMGKECLASGVNILIVDSVTHIWREICDSYLSHVNAEREKKRLPPRTRMEFQDWGPIKKKWAEWTMFYLNAPMHMIICGRAGFEYEQEVNEETGKKELIKAGTKMKTETEFGFEPSLLVEMERVSVPDGQGGHKMVHRATVNKDRFDVMDGQTCDDPTFEFFLPHVRLLHPDSHTEIRTAQTPMTVDEQGRTEMDRLKLRKTKAWEEVENGLSMIYPGVVGKDKQMKLSILSACTGSTSETAIQQMSVETLERLAIAVSRFGQDVTGGLQIEKPSVYVKYLYENPDAQAVGQDPPPGLTPQADQSASGPSTLTASNVSQQLRLCESIAEAASVMNAWEAEEHNAEDRASVRIVFDQTKKRLQSKRRGVRWSP